MKPLAATVLAWLALLLIGLAIIVASVDAHFYAGCQKRPCKQHVVKPHKQHILQIATCESGRRWHITGLHDGGLQFNPTTWNATGSRYARAHYAPRLEQMYRAVVWASMIGWAWRTSAGWPNCG